MCRCGHNELFHSSLPNGQRMSCGKVGCECKCWIEVQPIYLGNVSILDPKAKPLIPTKVEPASPPATDSDRCEKNVHSFSGMVRCLLAKGHPGFHSYEQLPRHVGNLPEWLRVGAQVRIKGCAPILEIANFDTLHEWAEIRLSWDSLEPATQSTQSGTQSNAIEHPPGSPGR